MAEGSESEGHLARSTSGIAPARDRGGSLALCLGLLIVAGFHCRSSKRSEQEQSRVSPFKARLIGINLQSGHILEMVTIAQSLKLSEQFPDTGMSHEAFTTRWNRLFGRVTTPKNAKLENIAF